jgi:hypothetical protein
MIDFIEVVRLGVGSSFGELALEKSGKRKARIV